MKFAHLADCHLGGWRHPELQQLNFESFRYALNLSKKEKVDFVLIAGDLFDSAYPPIETIKDTFDEFRKLKESNIPVFLIAGSHDYSVSGKSFLDVIEKAGFATNVYKFQERNGEIILEPTIYKNVAIYGFPGRKTGLEVYDLERIKLQDSPGLFKILMLHTTLKDALPGLDIPAVDPSKLPKVDYTALGHLHLLYEKDRRVYGGPIYPNNASELEDLKYGVFYMCTTSGEIKRQEIKLKEVLTLDFEINDSLEGTDKIIERLKEYDLKNKILILKLKGILERGKITDIDFNKIESFSKKQGVYSFLKNTTKLIFPIADIEIEYQNDNLEENVISKFKETHPHKYNELISPLLNILNFEKKEDELIRVFDDRLFGDINKILFS